MELLQANIIFLSTLLYSSFLLVPGGMYIGVKRDNWRFLQIYGVIVFLSIFFYVAAFLYLVFTHPDFI